MEFINVPVFLCTSNSWLKLQQNNLKSTTLQSRVATREKIITKVLQALNYYFKVLKITIILYTCISSIILFSEVLTDPSKHLVYYQLVY